MSLTLLRPWWLLALPLAVALAVLAGRRGALGGWRRAIDPALLAALRARGQFAPMRRGALLLPALLAAVVAVALTGPARERAAVRTWRNLDALVVAFDVSRSVAQGGNLVAARLAAARAIAAAAPRSIALIAYAGDAYLASGFTTDPAALSGTLAALDGDTVPDAGSRPERALAMARALLRQAHVIAGEVLLVSDGGGIGAAAYAGARAVAGDGDAVSTLFIPAGDALPDGAPRPDRVAMEVLAAQGGGVAAGIGAPGALLRRLSAQPAQRLAHSDFAALGYRDFGQWLLLLALVPAALLFRHRNTLAPAFSPRAGAKMALLVAAVFLLGAAPDPIRGAIALYGAGRYRQAAAEFARSGDPVADYDRGDALARAGDYAGALAAFDAALARDPSDADARANRTLLARLLAARTGRQAPGAAGAGGVKAARRDLPAPDTAQSNLGREGFIGTRQSRSTAFVTGASSVAPPRATAPDAAPGNGAKAKGSAAAGAGRTGPGGGPLPPAEAPLARMPPADPRLRERQQATEQWLATVPDDTGEFLRLRFAAEQQRRIGAGTAVAPGGDPW